MSRKRPFNPEQSESSGALERDQRILSITSIINVFVLSIAGVAVTWCSYQATLWSGIQAFSMARTAADYRQAQEEHEVIMQRV